MSIILQTSLHMVHSNPCLHALVFKQNSLISCYIITSIHLPLKPREWFCCPGLEKNMTSIHYRNFRQFQGVGSLQFKKKNPWVISFGQPNNNSISEFPSLLQVFFNNAELFKSTYPFKLQFILYHHLFKFKMKTKLLTFCPKFHLCFQSSPGFQTSRASGFLTHIFWHRRMTYWVNLFHLFPPIIYQSYHFIYSLLLP